MTAAPQWLQGVIAPMFTPVDERGALDTDGAAGLVAALADRGCVQTVFCRSGMGKIHTFTVDETRRLVAAVRAALPAGMGLIAGACGEWLTRDAGGRPDPDLYLSQSITLTDEVCALGADAAVHVPPSALEPGPGETHAALILRFFAALHEATRSPIVLYQPPGLPEPYRLDAEVMARLLELPRIVGIKISTTDDAVFRPLARAIADQAARRQGPAFSLICGHEGYYLRGLRQGAVGAIGQGCVGHPEIVAAVRERFLAGDTPGAEAAQADVIRALSATAGMDSCVALKQIMAADGYPVQPWDRSGGQPYPSERIERARVALQAVIAPYRRQAGRPA